MAAPAAHRPAGLPRNLLVWRKLAVASILGNVAEPLITLVAFGYGLGSLLPEVGGMRYIVFLAAGSVCMSTAMAASFESLYSAFSRMHVQRTWESILNAPLRLEDVLAAEWLWAASKAVFSGVAIVAVVFSLGISREPLLLMVIPVVALTGLAFSAIGLCFNALARGYDFFTYYFTLVMTPMVFLSGVYYPVDRLPGMAGAGGLGAAAGGGGGAGAPARARAVARAAMGGRSHCWRPTRWSGSGSRSR